MRSSIVALVGCLAILPSALSLPAAAASKQVIDALALGYVAYECNIPLSPARNIWLKGVIDASGPAVVEQGRQYGANNLGQNVANLGKKEACRRFRGMFRDLGRL